MMFLSRTHPFSERTFISCVAGVYDALESAEEAVRVLDIAGFPVEQITIMSRNPEGPGFLATGALAVVLLGDVEGVLYQNRAAGWLRQLLAWGMSLETIRSYEKRVQAGRALLIAHGDESETARALWWLSCKDALELQFHPKSRTEWLQRG